MKIEIFDELEKEEKTLRLRLERSVLHPERVNVVATDEHGARLPGGFILGISQKGIERFGGVRSSFGLALDTANRVKETD